MSFYEEDIRPSRFNREKELQILKDVAWLQSRKSEFVTVPCPACGADHHIDAFTKFGFNFVCCQDCETVYMSPRASSSLMGAFYAQSAVYEYWNNFIFPASAQVRRENIFRPRAQRLNELCDTHGLPEGVLMDVGAATGLFCLEVRNTGRFRRIIAVELNSAQVQSCRDAGLETIAHDISMTSDLDGKIDIITSFEVIEHMFSPEDFLVKCRKLLKPGGGIVISCPNYHGFDIQTLGVASDSLDAEHINLFNPKSLTLMFERTGFEVLECLTPGELDADIVHNQILKGKYAVTDQPFLKSVLIDRWEELGPSFQSFLKQARMSSHMWLVARLPKD